MYKNTNQTLITLVYTSLSIAMVALLTLAIRIPSVQGGYVNFGDIAIFITAALLGKRAGFFAGSIGSAIADIIGYPIYAPATFVIKGLEGLICGMLISGNIGKKNIYTLAASLAASAAWMVLGYFLFEYKIGGMLFQNQEFGLTTAVFNLPGNIVQGAVSATAAIPFIIALRKAGIPFIDRTKFR